jgi:hypothetical protein
MQAAGISGAHASPKGLRHAFGVCAIQSNIPLNLIQRWLGHADIKTTTIYTDAMGPEEREFASRMWVAEMGRSLKRTRRTISPSQPIPPIHEAAILVIPPEVLYDGRPAWFEQRTQRVRGSLLNLAAMLNYRVARVLNDDLTTDPPESILFTA